MKAHYTSGQTQYKMVIWSWWLGLPMIVPVLTVFSCYMPFHYIGPCTTNLMHFGKNQPSCIQPGVTRLFSDPSGISCFLFEEKVGELMVSSTMLLARLDLKFLDLILEAILDQSLQEATHSCINLGASEMDESNRRWEHGGYGWKFKSNLWTFNLGQDCFQAGWILMTNDPLIFISKFKIYIYILNSSLTLESLYNPPLFLVQL